MNKAAILAWLAIAAAGCGSSGSNGTDAAGTSGDGAPSSGDVPPGTCNFPSCLQALGASCLPAGSCVSQIGSSTLAVCYANGVRYTSSVGTGGTATLSLTNGALICLTGAFAGVSGTSVTFALQTPAGAALGTMTQDIATGATSVTCSGGAAVQLDPACWGGTGCDLGTCP